MVAEERRRCAALARPRGEPIELRRGDAGHRRAHDLVEHLVHDQARGADARDVAGRSERDAIAGGGVQSTTQHLLGRRQDALGRADALDLGEEARSR